ARRQRQMCIRDRIFIGSSVMGFGQGDVIIRAPNDPPGAWPPRPDARRCTQRANGVPGYGLIENLAQEIAGPQPAPGGYVPCVVSAAETTAAGDGIWEFDFISANPNAPPDNNPVPPILANEEWSGRLADRQNFTIAAWDVSVRAPGPGGAEIPGRVFANYLALNMGGNAGNGNPTTVGLYSRFYILTYDGYGYQVDMNGIDPFGFIFFANTKGITDLAGRPIYRSIQLTGSNLDQSLPPGYTIYNPRLPDNFATNDVTHKIFFDVNGPDPALPASAPSASGQTWLLTTPQPPPQPPGVTFVGEEGTPGRAGTNPLGGFFIFDNPGGTSYTLILDINRDGIFGNANDRTINGAADNGTNRVYWDGLDGDGVRVPAGPQSFGAQLRLNRGEVHFPFIDVENHQNGHRLLRVRGPAGTADLDPSLIYYNDAYNYTGSGAYDFSLCAATDAPPPPDRARVADPRCYGAALDARRVLQGAPSVAPGLPGAHRWTTATGGTSTQGFGDRRLIDTWTYLPSPPVTLTGQLVLAEADLSVEKSHSPPTLTPGGTVTYTVVVRNAGPSPAIGARVRDDVPAAVTGVTWTCAVTVGTGRCGNAAGSGNLIETTVDLDPGAAITYTIVGRLNPDAEGTLVNTALVRRPNDNTDPNLSNNTATDVAPIATVADLELTKTLASPPPLRANSVVTFTVALRNRGPGRATGVAVTDQLPAGLSFASAATTKGSYDSATGVWTVGTMVRDEVASLTIAAVWNGQPTVNTAQVSASDTPDPDSTPGNNDPNEDDQSSVRLPPNVADLELTKRVNAPRVNVGANATFTIELVNRGPDQATGVRVSDRLPIGLGYVSATPSQGSYDPGSGRWDVGTLAPNGRATLTLVVTVLGPGPFVNIAQVSASDQYDPDSTPNNDVPTEDDQGFAVVAGDLADLSLVKTVDNPQPRVGDEIVYTLTLRNAGPSAATGVEVTDRLPAGLAYLGHVPSQGAYDPASGRWSVGSVPAGGAATLRINARVLSFARIVNTAEVTRSDQPDPNSTPGNSDPTEDDQSSVALDPQGADLSLTKRANTTRPSLGGEVTFTIELINLGPSAATSVRVTERLPQGLTYLRHTTSQGSYAPATGVWEVGRVEIEAPVTLTLTARVDRAGPLTNLAEITNSDQPDPDSVPGNNQPGEDDSSTVTVQSPVADLSVSKRAVEPRPSATGEVGYVIGLHNAGPDVATGVRVGENLPPGATLVSATPSQGTYAAGVWEVGTLGAGQSATLALVVRLSGSPPYVNTVEVIASDLPDPDSTPNNGNPNEDDFASVSLPSGVIDLELDQDPVRAIGKLNDGALLRINLVNRGPDVATGVEVENLLPPELGFVSAAPSQGAYDPQTGRWTVGVLPPNGVAFLLLTTRVLPGDNREITNFAQVSRANEFDIDSTPGNRPLPVRVEDDEDVRTFSRLTPVTLKRFTAIQTPSGVQVEWETGVEINTLGFYLYRSSDGTRATAGRVTPSLVAARGSSSGGERYSFLDTAAMPGGAYTYWLVEVERGGQTSEYGPLTPINPTLVWLPVLRR
ncbi:MAG: DUF11 domain-containing protein, partial [Chloroflexaceae bacterium]|nr:DUF11 domain-containing protein [Chloroflexaceae bacterium]